MDDPSESARPLPAEVAAKQTRYDSDLYRWAVEQAKLLRAGKIAEADALNIAEQLEAFEDTRVQAAAQTNLGADAFPACCPYAWDDIMEREIAWPRKGD